MAAGCCDWVGAPAGVLSAQAAAIPTHSKKQRAAEQKAAREARKAAGAEAASVKAEA